MESEHKEVLRLVQEGKITTEEAARLWDAMSGEGDRTEESLPPEEGVPAEPAPRPPEPHRMARPPYWIFVLLFGLGWTLAGAALTLWALGTGWLLLTVPFLLAGLAVLSLGAASRHASWLSIRITDSDGRRKVALDFTPPLPVLAWGVQIARPFVPQLRERWTNSSCRCRRAASLANFSWWT